MIGLMLAAAVATTPTPPAPQVRQVTITETDLQVLNAIVQRAYVGSRCSASDPVACQAEPLLDDLAKRANAAPVETPKADGAKK